MSTNSVIDQSPTIAIPFAPKSTPHPAVQYLTALFDKDDVVCLTFIHGTKTYQNGQSVVENVFLPLSQIITAAGIKRLTERNKFWHIYVSMAPFKTGSKNRTKPNIAGVRHVFAEVDEHGDKTLADVQAAVAANEIPVPTMIVQSSAHKFQFIWNVVGFDIPTQVAMNKTLQMKFDTDGACVDPARVLRIPGFRNIKKKYGDSKPVVQIVDSDLLSHSTLADFDIPLAVKPDNAVYPPASDAAVQHSIEFLEAAMEAASVGYERKPWDGSNGAWKFLLDVCPWHENHENGGQSDAMAIVQPSGAYGFKCLHAHCADKKWEQFREHLENLAGHGLQFSARVNESEPEKPTPTSIEIVSVVASDVVPVPIEFLWEPYLQTNALNAYYGNPSVGKGHTTMDNIACVTTGRPFPTESSTNRKPMNVVVLAAEEGAADTIVPRLIAAGADLRKTRIIKSIRFHDKKDAIVERLITFQEDIAAVKADLQKHPDERFLVIDPITSYVGDINFNQDGEVRPVLSSLGQMAEELKITILIVGHFNKNTNVASALDKPGGGRAWTAVPRSVWGFFRFPTNKEQRAMVNLKLNNAKETETGLLFTIGGKVIGTKPDGKPWDVGVVQWGGKTESSADEIVASEHPEARRDSKGFDFLTKALKGGVRLASDVYDEGEAEHLSERTLKRACGHIGVLKYKTPSKGWFWQHPEDPTPIPDVAFGLNSEAQARRKQAAESAHVGDDAIQMDTRF